MKLSKAENGDALVSIELLIRAILATGATPQRIFRYGFDHLRHIILNLEQKMDDFQEVLNFLSCT